MSATATRILMVGTCSVDTQAMLGRLAKRGWKSCVAATLHAGRSLLKRSKFDLVLSTERLPDGRGYDFSKTLERQSGTLLVAIALSETPYGFRSLNGARTFWASAL
jgi:DNA-binding response OmpR family regulator